MELNKNIIDNYDNYWLNDDCILEMLSDFGIPLMYLSDTDKKIRLFKSIEGLIDTVSYEIKYKFENEEINVEDSIKNIKFENGYIIIPSTDSGNIRIKSLNQFVTEQIYIEIKNKLNST